MIRVRSSWPTCRRLGKRWGYSLLLRIARCSPCPSPASTAHIPMPCPVPGPSLWACLPSSLDRSYPRCRLRLDRLAEYFALPDRGRFGARLWLTGPAGLPEHLERWARLRGIKPVCPDTLSPADRAALARSAELLIGERDQRLADIGFCAPGARLVEIVSSDQDILSPFWGLAAARQLLHAVIHSELSTLGVEELLDAALLA